MKTRRVSSQSVRKISGLIRGIAAIGVLLVFLSFPGLCRAQKWDSSGHSAGAVLVYSSNEIVPGLTSGILTPWYSGEFAMNASILLRDPYNDNKMNFSPMGVFTAAAIYLGANPFNKEGGATTVCDILGSILLLSAAAMNSRHHFWFLGDPRPAADNSIRAALFAVSRTDVYTSHGEGWWRFCPAIGLEFDVPVSTPTTDPRRHELSGSSIAFDIGVDKPFDSVADQDITNEPRLFAGVRFYFARTTLIRIAESVGTQ
jgi:hypothetical protein